MKKLILLSFVLLTACGGDENSTTPDTSKPSETIHTLSINKKVIDNQKITLNPTDKENITFVKHLWTQTCGSKGIFNEQDKNSINLLLTAPQLDQDEKYCFEFNGVSDNGDKYLTKTVIDVVSPSLEVYVDHASLPTLQQLMDIIKSKKENPTAQRFIAWGRVHPSTMQMKELNITSFGLSSNHTTPELVNAVIKQAQNHHRLNITLSTNTAHSYSNLVPILKVLHNFNNVVIKKIDLYDDGSAEYTGLYGWRNDTDKLYELEFGLDSLKQVISGVSDEFKGHWLSQRYNWQKLYPATYHFLRKDYLTVEPKLHELREYLGHSLKQMQWNGFKTFDAKQQELFLSIVGFDKEKLQEEYNSSLLPDFVFTGTTTWSGNHEKEYYAKQQINVIENAINESSPYYLQKDYDLFFKGHPGGGLINTLIMKHFSKMIDIPAKVSFEVLMMTDMLPDAVAGMASSLYFTIPADKIKFIVFTSSDTITDREAALRSPLVQVMIKLGIVKEEKVLFWADLPNCETGICIAA